MSEALLNRQQEQDEQKKSGQFLTFWIDGQLYGISIEQVMQIIGVQKIVPMPQYPPYAKGIVNLRGDIIPVIDVRLRFHIAQAEYTERTCIIICSFNDMRVGFIVDAVDEVATIGENERTSAPDIAVGNHERFVTGIGKLSNKIILLLNIERVIRKEELEQLNA